MADTEILGATVDDTIPSISRICREFVTGFLGDNSLTEVLTSVRIGRSTGTSFLTSVAAHPAGVTDYFDLPERQRPFRFSGSPFKDIRRGSDHKVLFQRSRIGELNAALYTVSTCEQSAPTVSESEVINEDLDKYPFTLRIPRFLKHAESEELISKTRANSSNLYCLVVGRRAKSKSGKVHFDRFAAIYFVPKGDQTPTKLRGGDFSRQVEQAFIALFDAIDEARSKQATHFKLSSLDLVTRLIPIFQDQQKAPADKIAYMMGEIQKLLQRERVGKEVFGIRKKPPPAPRVYFVSTTFERPGSNDIVTYTPRFRLYPNIIAENNILSSFVIAHEDSVCGIKFGLARYWRKGPHILPRKGAKQKVRLNGTWQQDYTTPIRQYDSPQSDDVRADRIYLSSVKQPALWENLERSEANQKNEPNSILSFIIEGDLYMPPIARDSGELDDDQNTNDKLEFDPEGKEIRYLPKGILVFESTIADAFSDQEVEILNQLAVRVAPLIRSLTPAGGPIEYERALQQTYTEDVQDTNHGRLLYEIIRVDADMWYKIIDHLVSSKGDRFAFHGFSADELKKLIEYNQPMLERVVNREIATPVDASENLKPRRGYFLKHEGTLCRKYAKLARGDGIRRLEKLMDACPANFVWASYTRSIARAMAERPLERDPGLTRVNTKSFSAFDLLIASVSGELRQVIKLSSKPKLEQERRNYRHFVRYRLPIAARLPHSGYAFDSNGESGLEASTGDQPDFDSDHSRSYGALVSDLIDGRRSAAGNVASTPKPSTFLRKCAEIVKARDADDKALTSDTSDVLEALKFHFGLNVVHWKGVSPDRATSFYQAGKSGAVLKSEIEKHLKVYKDKERTTDFEKLIPKRFGSVPEIIRLLQSIEAWHVDQKTKRSEFKQVSFTYPIDYRTEESFFKGIQDNLNAASLAPFDEFVYHLRIVHGDMNGRNLAWSEPIKRFVPLDFEFVNFGFDGLDQAQLILSTICDLYGEVTGLEKPNAFYSQAELYRDTRQTLDDLCHLFDATIDQLVLDGTLLKDENPLTDGDHYLSVDHPVTHSTHSLCPDVSAFGDNRVIAIGRIINAIMGTLTRWGEEENQTYYQHVFLCAAATQFRYSLNDLEDDCIETLGATYHALVKERGADTDGFIVPMSPGELVFACRKSLSDQNTKIETRDSELIAMMARLLYSWSCFVGTRLAPSDT